MRLFFLNLKSFLALAALFMALARGLREFSVSPALIMLLIGISLGCIIGGALSVALSRPTRH